MFECSSGRQGKRYTKKWTNLHSLWSTAINSTETQECHIPFICHYYLKLIISVSRSYFQLLAGPSHDVEDWKQGFYLWRGDNSSCIQITHSEGWELLQLWICFRKLSDQSRGSSPHRSRQNHIYKTDMMCFLILPFWWGYFNFRFSSECYYFSILTCSFCSCFFWECKWTALAPRSPNTRPAIFSGPATRGLFTYTPHPAQGPPTPFRTRIPPWGSRRSPMELRSTRAMISSGTSDLKHSWLRAPRDQSPFWWTASGSPTCTSFRLPTWRSSPSSRIIWTPSTTCQSTSGENYQA